jgi:hypothetical protein
MAGFESGLARARFLLTSGGQEGCSSREEILRFLCKLKNKQVFSRSLSTGIQLFRLLLGAKDSR